MIITRLIKSIKYRVRYYYFKNKYRAYLGLNWKGNRFLEVDFEMAKSSVVDVREDISFRPGCAIRVRDNAKLTIGKSVCFSDGCILTCRDSITIGNRVMFGPHTVIFDNDHDFRSDDYINKYRTSPIIIEDNVWIGANVSILRGAHIKRGAVIGAGSVVTGIIEENCIYHNKQNIVTRLYTPNIGE